jgi:signal transduction histidine kinase
MTPKSRLLDKVLIAGTGIMAVASLLMLVWTINLVRDAGQSFRGNLTFYASQIEYETMQLIDHLDRFQFETGDVDHTELIIRFDILWSRINIPSETGVYEGAPLGLPIAADILRRTREILVEVEPALMNLKQTDAGAIVRLKSRLRSIVPMAHALVLAGKDENARANTSYLQNQLQQAYFTFAFIAGMVLFGVLSFLTLRNDRREIRKMNVELEERVQSRTSDLERANARLAAEVVERKRSQALAEEREARLEQAVQLAKLGYYIWDSVEDRCEYCSDQHARSHGLTVRGYIDTASKLDGTMALVHRDDRERIRKKYRDLRAGNIVEMDYRVDTPTGERRLREVARPIFDERGRVIKEIGSTIDLTDQYNTEMKLFEAQRMDSIGKLTGGIAHDFNNLLAVILGNLELLRETPEGEDRDDMINDAVNATLRGRDLTLNMLSFARRAPLDPTELDLEVILEGMQGLLRRTLPENIQLKIALPGSAWTVLADRSLTESALLNLVINARDAMPGGGQLTVEIANVHLDETLAGPGSDEIEPGDYVMMTVTDTGKGIDAKDLGRVFDPFFTTKSVARNSGLGLSMVQGFIRQTGGTIQVESEPGVGTTFKLYFRSVSQPSEAAQPDTPEFTLRAASGARILLVEDDETVRRVMSRQLTQSGYSVVAAADSDAAEAAFKDNGPFDLLVSDVMLPGDLQGPALAQRLREYQPDLPAVFLSGYAEEADLRGNRGQPDDITLMKPVTRIDLLAAIRDRLQP